MLYFIFTGFILIAIGVIAILAFTFLPSKTMEQVLNKVSTDNPGKGETPERKE